MSVRQAHFLINYWQAMFWKCRRFANLQSVKQYCINKLQNLVFLTQGQRVHVSARCAQGWREFYERRTHFLKTGVTGFWVSDGTVYFSQLFMGSGKLKPWTTVLAYAKNATFQNRRSLKIASKTWISRSFYLLIGRFTDLGNSPSVSNGQILEQLRLVMQWMHYFEFQRFFLQVLSPTPQLLVLSL